MDTTAAVRNLTADIVGLVIADAEDHGRHVEATQNAWDGWDFKSWAQSGYVRVSVDDNTIEVHAFTANGIAISEARFSNLPAAVIAAVVSALLS